MIHYPFSLQVHFLNFRFRHSGIFLPDIFFQVLVRFICERSNDNDWSNLKCTRKGSGKITSELLF
jgi:hypothetical protein